MAKFKPGQSGNPGGRPKIIAEVKELAREYTDAAVKALADIVQNKKAAPAARVAAAQALLDRGYGKPTQYVEAKVGPLDGLSVEDKRSLLEAVQALTAGADGAGEGASEVYH